MRMMLAALALAAMPVVAIAAQPDWAYPVTPQAAPSSDPNPKHVPGSAQAYTDAQINNRFGPPDWYPDEHKPMPPVVAQGVKPSVFACALCHLPTGDGHPESASLAGLSQPYLERQMAAFKDGHRTGTRATNMITIAKAIGGDDVTAASEYYAARTPAVWTKIVEAATVPKSFVGAGGMRFAAPDGGSEKIGHRIIVLPQDRELAENRDPHSGFIAYVPPGSIARGRALVGRGGAEGRTLACAVCHGPDLKGLGELPALAGRSPMYLYRQLADIKSGARNGGMVPLMGQVVAKLSDDDMIAISAYVGSLAP